MAGGSDADGAVHNDRRDDEEESDLLEHRGTTAGSSATQGRHVYDWSLEGHVDDWSEALRARQLALYVLL